MPPENPVIFTNFASCLTGTNATIALPSSQVDWDVEAVVVMSHTARNGSKVDACKHIAGVTVGPDPSERVLRLAEGFPHRLAAT